MGRKPKYGQIERIALGVAIAAASDAKIKEWPLLLSRGIELSRVTRVRLNALADYLDQEEVDEWLPAEDRRRFRKLMWPILEVTVLRPDLGEAESTASWSTSFIPAVGAGPGREINGALESAARLLTLMPRSFVDSWLSDKSWLDQTWAAQSVLKPGMLLMLQEAISGNLFTFRCASCGLTGYRLGRYGLKGEHLYCSDRCNSNGPHSGNRDQLKSIRDYVAEHLEQR